MACQHSPEDQTLQLQGAGQDDFIHLLSGPDRVAYERQEEVYLCLPLLMPMSHHKAPKIIWCSRGMDKKSQVVSKKKIYPVHGRIHDIVVW